jgi:CHAT domain-containing protein/tetratricopeptide (TPR) repeat protein
MPLRADPAAAVRQLLTQYVAGDLQNAALLWSPTTVAAPQSRSPRETFLAEHRRRIRARCARLVSLETQVVSESADAATVDTREAFLVDDSRLDSAHSRFVLRVEDGQWRIVSWDSRESALANQIAGATAARRAELLDASPELQTAAFVRALCRLAIVRVNESRNDDAAELIAIASAVAERLGDPAALAEAISTRSVVLRYRNPPDAHLAADLAREALDLATASGDPDSIAAALLRCARANETFTGVLDADPLRTFLAESADRVESPAMLSLLATSVTRALNAAGSIREGVQYAELTARFADESGDAAARISAEFVLAGVFTTYGGDHEVAIRHFRRAGELALVAGFQNAAALSFSSVAAVQKAAGREDDARATLAHALATLTAPQGVAELLKTRAWFLASDGALDAAESDLRRALELSPADAGLQLDVEVGLASIRYRQGRFEEAMATADRAVPLLDFARRFAMRWIRARVLYCTGDTEQALGLLGEIAAEADAQPIAISDPERLLFVGGLSGGLDGLWLNILVEQGRFAQALNVSERMKAAALRTIVANGGIGNRDILRPAERKAEQAVTARVATLNRALVKATDAAEIAALREQSAQARDDLVELRQRSFFGGPAARKQVGADVDLDALPSRLDDVIIVSYAPAEEITTIFVAGAKTNGRRALSVRVVPIGGAALSRLVRRFAGLINERNLRADAFGAELYELLLRPIEREIRAGHTLCVVPAGDLWHVPFHALAPSGGARLIDTVPVFYAPSISVLALAESRREQRPLKERPAVLAFANPHVEAKTASLYRAFDRTAPLGALPETETEVRAIGRIYGREHSSIRVGAEAREALLKRDAPRYDVLHIAAHGLINDESPMFSALLLSASPGEVGDDGLLEAREIAALDLGVDLAVFSACDTGKSSAGGVLGFSWALIAAGCPTTVVSQWNAQSASTAMLMIEFHRQLVVGASKPVALRRAQLLVRRDPRYHHPFYWAPFMIVGVP